jgi:tetratricopeptide (TPR) repeat protein
MVGAHSEIAGSLVPTTRLQAMILLEAAQLFQQMALTRQGDVLSVNLEAIDKAREVLNGAAVLMPKSEVPQQHLGHLELLLAKPEKALQAYRAAQRLNAKSSSTRAFVGEALLFLGKTVEASKELKAALELEPGSDGAAHAQALLDAVQRGDLPLKKAGPAPSAKKK